MTVSQLNEQYPTCETHHVKSVELKITAQDVLNRLRWLIDECDDARFVGEFDHYSHSLGQGPEYLNASIKDARCVLFCLGHQLEKLNDLALCPQSIGICETDDTIDIIYLLSPQKEHNEIIDEWINLSMQAEERIH